MNGLLTPRIEASEARLNGYRDQLTEHLKNVNDENVSDADLAATSELNNKIAQEEKTLESLNESQARLAKTSVGADDHQQRGEGDTRLAVYNPRPFALPAKKTQPLDYLWRSLCVQVKHHNEHGRRPILEVVKDTYGEDEPTRAMVQYLARAASAPATIPQAGWAAELVTQVWMDFLQALIPFSVFPGVAAKGSSYTFGRNGVINLPLRNATPSLAGSFVGEGAPIPVRQGGFATAQLTPKKLAVISTFTREIAEHSTPAIEGIIRESIMMDTGVAIDTVMLDANPATAVRPPGLLNGVVAIGATAAGAASIIALNGDLKALTNALNAATFGNIRDPVWLMQPQAATSASLAMTTTGDTPYRDEIARGTLLTYPIIKSTVVPAATLILMDAADYASVTEAAPRFDVSDQAVLHMDDTTPLAIGTPGTPPVVAAPARSLWQTDTIGVRMILPMNWLLRRAGMVQFMTGMTWL
jgi:HK97 family phage major capsid protein